MNQKPKKLYIGLPPGSYCQACGSFNVSEARFYNQVQCQDCSNTWTVELIECPDRICVAIDAHTEIGFSISSVSTWVYYRMKTPNLKIKLEGQTQDIILRGKAAEAVHALLRANATEIFQADVTETIAVTGYMRA